MNNVVNLSDRRKTQSAPTICPPVRIYSYAEVAKVERKDKRDWSDVGLLLYVGMELGPSPEGDGLPSEEMFASMQREYAEETGRSVVDAALARRQAFDDDMEASRKLRAKSISQKPVLRVI